MQLIIIFMGFLHLVYSDILKKEANKRCPCLERDVCLVMGNYQQFSDFQEFTPECPEEKLRCCSEKMMLQTLLKIQSLGGIGRSGSHQKLHQVELECRLPSECSQIYGSQQFHFIHISPQQGCPEPFNIRCVVPKERHEYGLQCIPAPLCLEIHGTKREHFQIYGYQTACKIGNVRCVQVKTHGNPGTAVVYILPENLSLFLLGPNECGFPILNINILAKVGQGLSHLQRLRCLH